MGTTAHAPLVWCWLKIKEIVFVSERRKHRFVCRLVYLLSHPQYPIAPPRLFFTLYTSYIRRVDLDGTRVTNVYNGGYPFALDFDFRSPITNENMYDLLM